MWCKRVTLQIKCGPVCKKIGHLGLRDYEGRVNAACWNFVTEKDSSGFGFDRYLQVFMELSLALQGRHFFVTHWRVWCVKIWLQSPTPYLSINHRVWQNFVIHPPSLWSYWVTPAVRKEHLRLQNVPGPCVTPPCCYPLSKKQQRSDKTSSEKGRGLTCYAKPVNKSNPDKTRGFSHEVLQTWPLNLHVCFHTMNENMFVHPFNT